ncbi:GNAT family N-acetyltransferase [Pararcticibacter amylolyticus]|uniref:N-acetyltransferase n=1 Tax=Pararcticibacter amylolyticus TaxID=2173175 RepID=A0A2U2PHS5_9SPHI|nr:GNAT family N-acetyltransferase [Pararcticibacter amylolyticus]PWG80814.1 N-acetyltransferase [Pararcticibacter amylolyticus]
MIRKAYPADKTAVSEILSRAFADNLSVLYIAGNGEDSKQKIKWLMDYAFEVCYRYGEVLVTEDFKGCALILYPELKKTDFTSLTLDLSLIWNCVGIMGIGKVLSREGKIKAMQLPGKSAYLWFIGVDPAFQRNGLGTLLMDKVVEISEAAGRFVMLETSTERNLPWYIRSGFSVYGTIDLGYLLYFLNRPTELQP